MAFLSITYFHDTESVEKVMLKNQVKDFSMVLCDIRFCSMEWCLLGVSIFLEEK